MYHIYDKLNLTKDLKKQVAQTMNERMQEYAEAHKGETWEIIKALLIGISVLVGILAASAVFIVLFHWVMAWLGLSLIEWLIILIILAILRL